jgi:hypothetical protein
MKKTIKPTPKQLKIIKIYWKELKKMQDAFYKGVVHLEKEMAKDTGINDIEFFHNEREFCGVGNASKTMRLIQL